MPNKILAGVLLTLCLLVVDNGEYAIGAEIPLPLDPQKAVEAWDFDEARAEIASDELLKQKVWKPREAKKKPLQGQWTTKNNIQLPAVLEAEVRMPVPPSTVTKGFSRANGILAFVQTSSEGQESLYSVGVNRGRVKDDVTYTGSTSFAGTANHVNFKQQYSASSISPLMDENERTVLERTIQNLPIAHERVHRLRLEVRKTGVRAYINGRLIGQNETPLQPGKARFVLHEDTHLVSLQVRPLEDYDPKFEPILLDDHCNARGTVRATDIAAEKGRIALLHGVPIITSGGFKGEDHLDLFSSVYLNRMGDFRAGDARESVHVPEELEPTRFTLRVPQRIYQRAWILAAADGSANTAPVLTIRFYRPKTCWNVDATAIVPAFSATTARDHAKRIAVSGNGKKSSSLWLLPIELDAAALAAEPMSTIEITKAIRPYRSWPDPAYYNSYPGGLPSGVRLYGLTLEAAPLWARGVGTRDGNLYTAGETPTWRVLMRNLSAKALDAKIDLLVTNPYGETSQHSQNVKLAANDEQKEFRFEPPASKFGLYTVTTTITAGEFGQTRVGTFLHLPKSTRKATGANSPWGLWCWHGGHDTQKSLDENARLLTTLGAINSFAFNHAEDKKGPSQNLFEYRQKHNLGAMHFRLVDRTLPKWASEDPYDPAAYAAFAEEKGKEAAELLKQHPDLQFVNFFAENHISLRLTHGMSPWAMGQPYFNYTPEEAARLRAHWLTAKSAAEGVRKHAPSLKIIFGHGAGNFAQPFFRLPDWKNDMFDGFGMDLPQFERMPERQPRATEPNLLFFLHHQMKEKGLAGKEVIHLESYFPSQHPQGLTAGEQADSVARTAVLSLALGTTRFMRTWTLHTSGDGWGSSHYGTAGLIDRSPEFNPKPSAAAFATMTQVLDLAKYDGWLDTGSRSAFCVRFKDTDRLVYAAWTVRGKRPLEVKASAGAKLTRYDMHGNAFPVELTNGTGTITLSSSPEWIVVQGGNISSATVGVPSYSEAPPKIVRKLEDFEKSEWKYDAAAYDRFQNNHWDMPREVGAMASQRVASSERKSNVLRVELTKPDAKKPLVGFYGQFVPSQPIEIAGRATALGMHVNGHSAWNRFIYEVVDAKGETWLSCGTRDAWNCDDIHSWSSANHDGWRYMRFPLPSNSPGDHFREPDSVWWGSDAEGIVDLPLKLTRIIVEMRPQMIYVNELLPNQDLSLEFDDLVAEYASQADTTNTPVQIQRDAYSAMLKGDVAPLANPFTELQRSGTGAAPKIAKLYPPPDFYNGTRLNVEVQTVDGATRYRGYVSAHADGRGAKPLAIDKLSSHKFAKTLTAPNVLLFDGLRASTSMYVFVTAIDAEGKESKPSAIREVVLKDEFPFK